MLVFEMKLGAEVVIWNGGIYCGLIGPFPNIHLLVGCLLLLSFQRKKLESCNRVFQVPVDGLCVFCSSSIEFRDHLFFGSSFNRRVWEITIKLFLVSFAKTDWQDSMS